MMGFTSFNPSYKHAGSTPFGARKPKDVDGRDKPGP
jgi:hypothetical protein